MRPSLLETSVPSDIAIVHHVPLSSHFTVATIIPSPTTFPSMCAPCGAPQTARLFVAVCLRPSRTFSAVIHSQRAETSPPQASGSRRRRRPGRPQSVPHGHTGARDPDPATPSGSDHVADKFLKFGVSKIDFSHHCTTSSPRRRRPHRRHTARKRLRAMPMRT